MCSVDIDELEPDEAKLRAFGRAACRAAQTWIIGVTSDLGIAGMFHGRRGRGVLVSCAMHLEVQWLDAHADNSYSAAMVRGARGLFE